MLIVGEQGEKRIDPENSSALTFEKLLEAYKSQFNVAECHRYWSKYMALLECLLFTLKGRAIGVSVVHIERLADDMRRTAPPDW